MDLSRFNLLVGKGVSIWVGSSDLGRKKFELNRLNMILVQTIATWAGSARIPEQYIRLKTARLALPQIRNDILRVPSRNSELKFLISLALQFSKIGFDRQFVLVD